MEALYQDVVDVRNQMHDAIRSSIPKKNCTNASHEGRNA